MDGMYREKCAECGTEINTTPGMDAYTEVTDYTTTDYESAVFCDRDCLRRSLNPATDQQENDTDA